MARARNIKPGFFANENLVELPYETRLLFIGMWTLADREGRLENRPKRIKMALFPADSMDVDSQISALQKCGFLRCYSINGIDVIQIENFAKHQSPHGLEKDSELPDDNGFYTVNERSKSKLITGSVKLVKSLNTVTNQLENSFLTVEELDRNALNPDSLIPDSLNPEVIPQTPSGIVAPKKKAGIALKTFIEDCKAKGERPLRDYASLWTYTKAVGISEEFIALAWAEFCRRFMPGGAQSEKRQKDWRLTFRKYVENNYFKLWAIDQNGTYFLTTLGKQAEKFQEVSA